MKKIIAIVLGVILLGFGFVIYSAYRQESKRPAFIGASDFTALINAERTKHSLPTLLDSRELQEIAERKCNDMVSRHYVAHKDPDGKFIWDYAPQGFKYGENIAGSFYSSNETVKKWIASPEHLENIVDPMFKEVGHYTCYDGGQYLSVEVFQS